MKNIERDFVPISCNSFDCIHKDGSNCKKKTVRIDNNGNCADYKPREKK